MIQRIVQSDASLAVQSPFGFSFISSHHLSLLTSGENTITIAIKQKKQKAESF
jgi:hypothetical protein